MGKWILLFVYVTATQVTYAQTIKLSGLITDRQGKNIDMATVVVKNDIDKIVAGCTSDSTGFFSMNIIPQQALLYITCVGYTGYTQQIDCGSKDIFVNAILDTATIDLGDVVITSKLPYVRREIDRIVLNTEKINAVAANFMDVLKHTPGIIVQDNTINMLSKGKIIVLINGRELKMDMKGLVSYLSSLSSDNLKQIEVMTTPPAKYFAEGNAGVINFVTKNLRNNYFGGNVLNQLSIKEHTYNDVSLGLQYKYNKTEAYANIGIGLGTMQFENNNHTYYPSETWNTTSFRLKSNDYVLAIAGFDYILTKYSSLGAIVSYSNMRPDAENKAKTSVLSYSHSDSPKYFETLTDFKSNYNRYNVNLHYTINEIGKGGKFNANADYLNYTINDSVNLQTLYDESLFYVNRPKTTICIYQGKADMELTIGNAILSYGAAYSQSKTDNRTCYERISRNYDLNDHFVYNEYIIASYADMRYRFSDNWEAKVGIRGEYGKLDGNSIKLNTRNIKHQFDLFPTAYIDYSWNNNKTISLSLSSRINRPSYVDINPFTTYIDAHTVQSGNPKLLPEKSYSFEIGYTFSDFSVLASMTLRNKVISSYASIDNIKKLTTLTVDNIMKMRMYSLDVSYIFNKLSWLDSTIDGSLYTVASKSEFNYSLGNSNYTSVYLYINNNFYLNQKKTIIANLWGQYQTKEKDVVGESPVRYRVDLGLKFMLFDKKLLIGLDYQNMLTSHLKSIIRSEDATYIYDRMPYRVLKISISYKFGKQLNINPKKSSINTNRL